MILCMREGRDSQTSSNNIDLRADVSRVSITQNFLVFLLPTCYEMDQMQDQQQKDILEFLYQDPSNNTHHHEVLPNRIPVALQNVSQQANSHFGQQNLDLVAMSNLMSLHGLEPTATSSSHTSPAAFTPQMLLEQQYKLTQLHQLQQLQNQIQSQIFQQQARPFFRDIAF